MTKTFECWGCFIGVAIIAVIIWGFILFVKGIIALFIYTFGLVERLVKGIISFIEGIYNTLIDLYNAHHEFNCLLNF